MEEEFIMDINLYQEYVRQGASEKYNDISFAALALVGEVGEVCDVVKKSNIYTDIASEEDANLKLLDELGDVLWQWMACVNALDISAEAVIDYNVQKLNARHGGAKLDTTGGKR